MSEFINYIYTLALNLTLLASVGVLACSLTGIIYIVAEGKSHDDRSNR